MMRLILKYKIPIAGVAVILLVAVFTGYLFVKEDISSSRENLVIVARGDIAAHIVDRGVVRPARVAPVSSLISSNQAKIVWLVEEGTKVQKGSSIAKFDTKPFQDKLHKAEQLFGDADATYLAAEKLLDLQKEEEAGKREEAVRKMEIAEIKANNLKNGSGPLKKKVLVQKLNQAKRALKIGQDELGDMTTLLAKGHVSSREKDKASDKVTTAEEQAAVAQAEIDNFTTYVWPQMLREGELLVNAAVSELERVQRTAELLIQNRAAEVEKSRRKLENRKVLLLRAQQDIANCSVYAPAAGVLLYSELPRESGRRKIQIGDSVWVGQTFLEIPDTTELIAEIHVREVDVAKIMVGMAASIEVDAYPGKVFKGRVGSIASLAKEDEHNSGIRRFHTKIAFTGDFSDVHVGMSVTTKVLYGGVENTVLVPISAVVYRSGSAVVYKKKGADIVAAHVEVGIEGTQYVEILDGIDAGDRILKEAL
jgi:HlyD family secretion protein